MPPAALSVDFSDAHLVAAGTKTERAALTRAITALRAATLNGYRDDSAFVNLCIDAETAAACKRLARAYAGTDLVILVGIGGPNLAVRSVHEAIIGATTESTIKQKILYADTTDAHQAQSIVYELNHAIAAKKKVLVILASKSGTTTESVANAQLLLGTLAKHTEHWAKYVVAISDEQSPLWHEARTHGIATLTIPAKVGGRYSVFSAMGLFPLAVLGVDITKLLAGAAAMRARCLAEKAALENNPAAALALLQFAHARHGRSINEYFVFSKDLESVGRWYRQLLAESCGKERSADGKKLLHAGITPTVCVGTNDLHSVGQLALGGPDDKFTLFVEIAKTERVAVPSKGVLRGLAPHLGGTDFHHIHRAIAEGTRRAYTDAERPWVAIALPARDEYAIGQLLQMHLMQTVYLAALLGVNAFDQPAVELYKEHTRTILAKR